MLLTAGERISMSLLGIALNARGCRAASYTGSQAGIITDTRHGAAKITEIRPKRIVEALEAGTVVILAGFQGTVERLRDHDARSRRLRSHGRRDGGCRRCRRLRDLHRRRRGVHCRPAHRSGARKVDMIGYDEMLELAAAGAKVLQTRSVEMARRHGVKIHVRSAFDDVAGTWVRERSEDEMEGVLISGIALDAEEAKVTIDDVPDRPGVAARVFKAIAAEGVNVDMIVQNVSHEDTTDLSFTAPRADLQRLRSALESLTAEVGAGALHDRRRHREALARRCRG
jgi:aspartate kinase